MAVKAALHRDIKEKAWTLDWGLLKTHVDPYDAKSCWAGVATSHPLPEVPQGRPPRFILSICQVFLWASPQEGAPRFTMGCSSWLKARTRRASVLRPLLGTREGQQATATEVVLLQATVSGDMYLLAESTCDYQTADRKLKIVAPNICPIKCHYNTSTHLSFLPA